jgi:23S rRNA (cytosine1962-C5)-methyltransferase
MLDTDRRLLLERALAARAPLIDEEHVHALRLFNGHLEGDARYVIDAYGRTAVAYRNDATDRSGGGGDSEVVELVALLRARLPWLEAFVVKERKGGTVDARRGRVVHVERPGAAPDTVVEEHGVRYAIDLLMNQDASFYLDTRLLRRWLIDHSAGKSVLNTFAYTGSLGVAARAGGASKVVHTDRNARFLDLAKASYALNGFDVDRADFLARDFYSVTRGLKLQGARFDCVILDPPFFSSTKGGTVDLNRNVGRLINKLRPLVRSGGKLVVVNNALFLSGADHHRELEALCEGGWLAIDGIVDVPADVTGYPSTLRGAPPVDPAPYAHSTKITILEVRHKD